MPIILKDQPYNSGTLALRQCLDIYHPETGTGPWPTVIRIHGGGWQAFSKDDPHVAHRLLEYGFALVTINYRYSTQAPFPAQLEDVKAAVRWTRAAGPAYNLATERIGVVGDSAGGHLACLLGVGGGLAEYDVGDHLEQSSAVQAVVAWYPPTDLLRWPEHARTHDLAEDLACLEPLIGGAPEERLEAVKRASPITHVTSTAAPTLLLHGDADPVVPYPQSEVLCDALKAAGVEARLIRIPGGGHGGPLFETDEAFLPIVEFLKRHLLGR